MLLAVAIFLTALAMPLVAFAVHRLCSRLALAAERNKAVGRTIQGFLFLLAAVVLTGMACASFSEFPARRKLSTSLHTPLAPPELTLDALFEREFGPTSSKHK